MSQTIHTIPIICRLDLCEARPKGSRVMPLFEIGSGRVASADSWLVGLVVKCCVSNSTQDPYYL